jgi:hypothetical protein
MTEFKTNRRCGVKRREFQYTLYIPERRSGLERRCAKNGKEIIWRKYQKTASKEKQPGSIEAT